MHDAPAVCGLEGRRPGHDIVERDAVLERDGRREVLLLRPYYDAEVERNRLGFGFRGGGLVATNPGPIGAADRSVEFMWLVTHKTVEVFATLVDPEQRKQVSGVVGSYEVTRQAIDFGAREALTLIAVISLSLGLINLFPFLPLDGGRITDGGETWADEHTGESPRRLATELYETGPYPAAVPHLYESLEQRLAAVDR